ncbi:hypothetical protein [Sorangium sp. So ce693]|uniref:hypothetical protein n=1 Tax=Sorangium sp. So ce693 TaxID=3133318 RepID=UPI003F63D654
MLEIADRLGVIGADKLGQDAGDLHKLNNLVVEVYFASLFAASGAAYVSVFPDNPIASTPDLDVRLPNGLRFYVEVTRLSPGDPSIVELLQSEIETRQLPYRVEYLLGERLSLSVVSGRERGANEEVVEGVVRCGVVGLLDEAIRGTKRGAVHVVAVPQSDGQSRLEARFEAIDVEKSGFPISPAGTRSPVEVHMVSFIFGPPPDGEGHPGYAAGGITAAHLLNEQSQRERLVRDIRAKAEKRQKWPDELPRYPYVVAVQNDESELTPVDVLSALTGSRCAWLGDAESKKRFLERNPVTHPEEVAIAESNGWEEVLREWDFAKDADVCFVKYGSFIQEFDWVRNLAGVLVVHHSQTLIQWLPNPFARDADVRFAKVGLPLDKLGAHVTPD